VNETDRQLRDLLEAAVGEPPHQVSVEAVRRRVTRRRAVESIIAAAVVAVAILVPTGIRALGHNLRPAGQQQSATVYVGGHSDTIAVTPDGKTAYVINDTSGTVIPISTATNTPGPPIHIGPPPGAVAFFPDGKTAYDTIAITPDGKTAYAADNAAGTVIPISTATNTPGPPIHVGSDVTIAFTPDGKTAYVVTWVKVIPISTATNTPGKPIRTGGGPPGAISITP
jgi:DNA-binding beta-propeller fold protein YncE